MQAASRLFREHGIDLVAHGDRTAAQRRWVAEHFQREVLPLLMPVGLDPAHPFPFLPNLGFALVLQLRRRQDGSALTAVLPLPNQVRRFVRLPGEAIRFLSLENRVRKAVFSTAWAGSAVGPSGNRAAT